MAREQSWDRQSNKMEGAWVPGAGAHVSYGRQESPLSLLFKLPSSVSGHPSPAPQNLGGAGPAESPPAPPCWRPSSPPLPCLGHKRLLRALSKRRDVGEFSPFVQMSIHIFFLHWFYRRPKLLHFQGLCYPASPAPPSRGARRRLLGTHSAWVPVPGSCDR